MAPPVLLTPETELVTLLRRVQWNSPTGSVVAGVAIFFVSALALFVLYNVVDWFIAKYLHPRYPGALEFAHKAKLHGLRTMNHLPRCPLCIERDGGRQLQAAPTPIGNPGDRCDNLELSSAIDARELEARLQVVQSNEQQYEQQQQHHQDQDQGVTNGRTPDGSQVELNPRASTG